MVVIGAVAFFSGILGGIKIQGLEIPSMPIWGRIISVIIGVFFISMASWPFVRDNILLTTIPSQPTPNIQVDTPPIATKSEVIISGTPNTPAPSPPPTVSPVLKTATVSPTATTAGTKKPSVAIDENPPADNEIWINTYPPGAEIYLVPATSSIYDLILEDVIKPGNLIGNAPVTYELSAGSYFIIAMFPAEIFISSGYSLPKQSDPTFEYAFPFDGNFSQNFTFADGEEIDSISKMYRLVKVARNAESLISIALPLPEEQRGQRKPTLYPTMATVESIPAHYDFQEEGVRRAINDNLRKNNMLSAIEPVMIDEMIEVLHRVGKVKLDTDGADLIVQMMSPGSKNFSISVYE
jgi:hypothetical protein